MTKISDLENENLDLEISTKEQRRPKLTGKSFPLFQENLKPQ
jgi:hypothetical protein